MIKDERLKSDPWVSCVGVWLRTSGDCTEGRKSKRVAVSMFQSTAKVGHELMKEAMQGIGFDLLIVRDSAFSPHVTEESWRYC